MRSVLHRIHRCSISIVVALAGSLTIALTAQSAPSQGFKMSTYAGVTGSAGSQDGPIETARFDNPTGLVIDSSGNVFVAEEGSHTIRKITPAGVVSTVAGLAGVPGSDDGIGTAARFNKPQGLAIAGDGTLYVADTANSTIRKVTQAGVVTTVAGLAGVVGSTDGPGATARFNQPWGVAVDGFGNVFVTDTFNSAIRKIAPDGVVSTYAGEALHTGSLDGPVDFARFFLPDGLAFGPDGTLYVADEGNNTIRMISTAGIVSTLAGAPGVSGSDDGIGHDARFNQAEDVTVDAGGNVYVIDESNFTLRKITRAGLVTTIAGTAGLPGDADGVGSGASFGEMEAIAVDHSGRLFVTDIDHDTIRLGVRQELIDNGDFGLGSAGWATSDSDMSWNVIGGVLRFHMPGSDVPPTGLPSSRSAIYQQTGMTMSNGAPVTVSFDLGNTSTLRKRLNLFVADGDLSDLAVCTFWLAPNAPMRTYQVRTHTTHTWTNTSILFAPSDDSAGDDGGDYVVDNVSVRDGAASQSVTRTDCVDPTAPTAPGGLSSGNLLVNSSFAAGLVDPWFVYGDATSRINAGVFEFLRPGTPGVPAGVVLQETAQTMNPNQVVSATLQLGNSSSARKRVALLLHDRDFSDLGVCTFWLEPSQPLSPYTIRTFATKNWVNATLSLYAATMGSEGWIRMDDVTFQRSSTVTTVGTVCLEPGEPQ